ncbi:LytS/YhcK type 5TM receptor domain-containing protein [Anaerobacillus sp. MEB173]|uniref:LytS/YhcK type 5TM receptor domain-containing protein n=1 Tax=Anaerobacillus sp. MEB173 TaxID=3383345 RepID=UPI003F92C6D0
MDHITIALFERMGIFLLLAFIFTRIPSFKNLLDREMNWKIAIYYSIIFGMFSITGALAGFVIEDGEFIRTLLIPIVGESAGLAHTGIVGLVMGGLLGGPIVGLGAGVIAGIHFAINGGMTAVSYAVAAPFIGVFAGFFARFFSKERVITPAKSLFIGMFASIMAMCFVLAFTTPAHVSVEFVNLVGIPMVISNSVAISIFTLMIRVALSEKEQAQALETRRTLTIAEQILPHLKQGLNFETARTTAQLLMDELKPTAVAVTDAKQILAHVGSGSDHHLIGERILTKSFFTALASGKVEIYTDHEQLQCSEKNCPLGAAIVVPFSQSGQVAGLIKLYYKRPQQITSADVALAQGLGKLISNQLSLAEAERMSKLMKEAELRTLQAQINPHFLFNTLNTIVSLIRVQPAVAKNVTIELAQFMRANLKILSKPLISLTQEINHILSYLKIVDVRFSDQLHVEIDIDEDLKEAFIPPSTIQPLVENCIQHGLKNTATGGVIGIKIRQLENEVYLSIEDNGSGVDENLLDYLGIIPLQQKKGNGVGVYNVNQRLTTLLGSKSALKIRNKNEGGTRISFVIPNVSSLEEGDYIEH